VVPDTEGEGAAAIGAEAEEATNDGEGAAATTAGAEVATTDGDAGEAAADEEACTLLDEGTGATLLGLGAGFAEEVATGLLEGGEEASGQKVMRRLTLSAWQATCTCVSSGTKNAVLQLSVVQVAPWPSHPP